MASSEPQREPLGERWLELHGGLHGNVRDALTALPAFFRTETMIAGITATDLHTLNTVLGATIEEQVIRVLNSMRNVWDPEERYLRYHFVRQAQTHPDVLLREIGAAGSEGVLLGIELKGWYLLSKEGEPSLRFTATRYASTPQDLVAVVPWALSNVISGTPIAYQPWIESARYCAAMRSFYWQVRRSPTREIERAIHLPENVTPYPAKTDRISDVPVSDEGGNFGRLARTGIMDDYIGSMRETPLCGIPVCYWLDFFRAFRDNTTPERIRADLARLTHQISISTPEDPRHQAIEAIVRSVLALTDEEQPA